ncbi:MAG: primosomal protein N' [Elusimicrobiota bacterium]
MTILEIVCPIPLLRTFDYILPDSLGVLDPMDLIGSRVRIPFGFRDVMGLVVGVKTHSDFDEKKLKPIRSVIDQKPLLTPSLIEVGKKISHDTLSSLGETLFSFFPSKGKISDEETALIQSSHSFENLARQLSVDQQKAIEKIHQLLHEGSPQEILLLGVSAAGKTEVYLSAIQDVLAQGKEALFLVPEVGLSYQMFEMAKQKFNSSQVVLWNGQKTEKERWHMWDQVKKGDVSIVVGTRSALFLPFPQLGLIIVDEEQDSAYKEQRKPRYLTSRAAKIRGKIESAHVLFGSATPSLEIFHEAKTGKMNLIELSERVVATSKPKIDLIDLKVEKKKGGFSFRLLKEIERTAKEKKKTILFINKRGFFRYLRCPVCSWVAKCPHCAVSLIQHKKKDQITSVITELKKKKTIKKYLEVLECHTCGYHQPSPSECPECHEKKLFAGGFGTERVEEELKENFPWIHSLRWDSDSLSKKGKQEEAYQKSLGDDVDVLVGTQMVAQGFNFPGVTLVGVIDADSSLHLPDFRAAEKTFQLIAQVAGRAGREMVTGQVYIQTHHAEHEALQLAAQLDYAGFSEKELKHRYDLIYPPFSRLMTVRTMEKKKNNVEKKMNDFIEKISNTEWPEAIGILGPYPAKGKDFKGQLQVLFKVPHPSFEIFLQFLREKYFFSTPQFWVDVDPF